MLENGKTYIVEARFAWTDYQQYDCVFGKCSIYDADKEAGFTLRRSENWFLKVTGESGEVIIPGCRVGILVRTDTVPELIMPSEEELKRSWRKEPVKMLVL